MKKVCVGIIAIVMVLSIGMTAFAAETITEQNGSQQIDVQAKSVNINPENMYTEAVSEGTASITTQSGTTISVSANGTVLEGLQLHIIEIIGSEQEAYQWIFALMNGLCERFTAYDIWFSDQDGNRIPVTDDVTISITTPDGYTNIQVYHIDANAKINKVASKQSGGNTLFIATSFSYYVIADKANDGGTTQPSNPGNPVLPQTGDTSNNVLWISLLFLSVGVITAFLIAHKHKMKNNNR